MLAWVGSMRQGPCCQLWVLRIAFGKTIHTAAIPSLPLTGLQDPARETPIQPGLQVVYGSDVLTVWNRYHTPLHFHGLTTGLATK